MSVQFCIALLALSSLAATSDPACDELIKPLEDPAEVTGKWIFHAGTTNSKDFMEELINVSSSWFELSAVPDTDKMILRWGNKMNGNCHYGSIDYTFSGNSSTLTFQPCNTTHIHVGRYVASCPDCLVWMDTFVTDGKNGETRKGKNLYLFTKTGTLDESHLDMFKKQALCHGFLMEFQFGENTDLCPDDTRAKEEEQ